MHSTHLMLLLLNIATVKSDFQANYSDVIKLSLLFFESQRSGKLPENNRISWRGDSGLNDSGILGENLTGGYYDSTDFVKFGFTMGFSTTILSWGVISYEEAYKKVGQYERVLEAIKWTADYFVKCHTKKNEFYAQVGDFSLDHVFWGRPEEMNMSRPAYKIDEEHAGSDLAGEASALFASSSIVFKDINMTYSKELLGHSLELFNFAKSFRGLYQNVISGAKLYYESKSYGDELTWASLWLFKATNDLKYLQEAQEYYKEFNLKNERADRFFYNDKIIGIELLLAENLKNQESLDRVQDFCDYIIFKHKKTPKGLLYIDKFATLPHAASISFICLEAATLPNFSKEIYINFAKNQIDYMLGSSGRSYVVGYGRNFPKKPFHSASSCPNVPKTCGWEQYFSKSENPQILYGALVSGPDNNDFYDDDRQEFLYNEVGIDFNSAFQSVLAGLIYYFE